MQDARKHEDWQALRASAVRLVRLLNGSPDALLEVASADARLGDRAAAIAELRTIARMWQSQDLITSLPEFATLRARCDFASISRRMAANMVPVSRSATVATIPEAGLLPEDIDYDPHGKRFYLSSVLERKIVSIDAGGHLAGVVHAPDDWPMLALKVGARRRLLWATEVAMDGFRNVPKRDWGRSAVLCYDLTTSKLLRRIEGPRPSNLGDMTLAANGDLLISDSAGGGIYLVRRNGSALKRADKGDFISPETPAYAPGDHEAFIRLKARRRPSIRITA